MSSIGKYGKLLFTLTVCTVLSDTVYARMADSIFDNEEGFKKVTAEIVKMDQPVSPEQVRYEFDNQSKVNPSSELERLLTAAEKVTNAVIEEHNRRVDIMALQEVYTKNLHSKDVANKAKELLDAADACNSAQLSPLFETGPNVSLDIRDGDNPSGTSPWYRWFKPYLIGTYTEKLNDKKFAAGIWWGGAFEPTRMEEKVFAEATQDDFKSGRKPAGVEKVSPDLYKNWESLVNSDYVRKRVGANSLVKLLPDYAVLPGTPPTSATWDTDFNYVASEDSARKKLYNYKLERWKLGYDLLMAIYHYGAYGILNEAYRKAQWSDQRRRYQGEIIPNYFAYIESHNRDVGYYDPPDIDDWDSIRNYKGKESKWTGWDKDLTKLKNKYASKHSSQLRYTCCEYCGDPPSCCKTVLIYDTAPEGKDSGESPRRGQCDDGIPRGPDITEAIKPPPRPLILNGASPSPEESVFIDSDGGAYKLYLGGSDHYIKGTNLDKTRYIPDVWDADYNTNGSDMGLTYYEPVRGTPIPFKGGFSGEYAYIKNSANYPLNQNRISAYLDIYEEYVRAMNNAVKSLGNSFVDNQGFIVTYGVNGEINNALNEMLQQLKNRIDAGYYDFGNFAEHQDLSFKGAEKLSATAVSNLNFNSSADMAKVYEESISRQNAMYYFAKDLLKAIGTELKKEYNRTVKTYDEASDELYSKKEPENISSDGNGPEIPSSPEKNVFLYRLGLVYQTLAYFDQGSIISTNTTPFYVPETNYSSDNGGVFENRVERIRLDGNFGVSPFADYRDWGDSHTSRTPLTDNYTNNTEFRDKDDADYVQIGLKGKLSDKVSGKSISDLENSNLSDLYRAIDEQRKNRLDRMESLIKTRQFAATKLKSSLSGASGMNSLISINNYDTNKCLFIKH